MDRDQIQYGLGPLKGYYHYHKALLLSIWSKKFSHLYKYLTYIMKSRVLRTSKLALSSPKTTYRNIKYNVPEYKILYLNKDIIYYHIW